MPLSEGQLILGGVAQGLSKGFDAFQSERQRIAERQRWDDDKKQKEGLLKLKGMEQGLMFDPDTREIAKAPQGLMKSAPVTSGAASGVLQKLYPELEGMDLSGLSDSQISNVFKVQRQRESIKGRENLEGKKFDQRRGLLRRTGPSGIAGGRSPQEGGKLMEWDPKAVERYQKQLIASSKGLKEIAGSAKTIETFTEMAKTNPATVAALPVLLARAIGEKGPLSNFDIKMWGGSKAVIARLHRAAQQAYDGTFPDEDVKFIKEVALVLGRAAEDRLSGIEQDMVEKYSANYGGEPEGNYRLITGRHKTAPQESKAPGGAVKKLYSPSRNQTKIIHPDGREEIVDGKQ